MDHASVLRSYRIQSRFYDWVSGPLLAPGRARALRAIAPQPGERVLEIGVGTGLTLTRYPAGVHLTGIDLSEAMLAKARARAEAAGRSDIHLEAMDAQDLKFKDASFDQVVAMYVVSVAPDAAQVLREMRRVCKPGGTLTVVNLLAGTQPLHNGLRRLLTPLTPHLGFRPLFSLPQFRAIDNGLAWEAVDGKDYGLAVLQAVNR